MLGKTLSLFQNLLLMKRLFFLFVLLLPLLSMAQIPVSQQMVNSHGLGDFNSNKNLKYSLSNAGWDYVSGLVANSVLKAWEQYPEKTNYYNAVKAFADNCTSSDGSVIGYGGWPALGTSNIDDLAAGKIFFKLYTEEKKKGNPNAKRYKNAATVIRNNLKYEHSRIAEGLPGTGGFYHKASYPSQMWLDGLYMGPAVYAQWQYTFGADSAETNYSSWSDIALQFKTIHKYTYDSEKQLNYHGWAAIPTDVNAFWSNQSDPYKGCSKEFWGRGMGWYFAALVDVLELMPKDHEDYDDLLAICNQVASGLKRWQDEQSGVWFQLLQYDGSKKSDGNGVYVDGKVYNNTILQNYLESSCSCMFTYAFFKGVRLGLLDKEEFLPIAEKAYEGLLKTFIVKNGSKIDIIQSCASAGLGPSNNSSRNGTVNYYLSGKDVDITQNEGKAIGPFIMASLENEIKDTTVTDIISAKKICDKICYFDVPADGVYMIRYNSITNPYSFKQSCKAGLNLLCISEDLAGDNDSLDIYSGNGLLVSQQSISKK